MARFHIQAVRYYYSVKEFEVDAKDEDEAQKIALQKIDDCEVEFDGIDGIDTDAIEDMWEVKENV